MIRPFTCLSLVAACGAGLYLYQVKHRAQMVDREITRAMKDTDQTRDRISLLKTEWAGLTATSRLAELAGQHLQLQPLQPTQFVRMEDLRGRLPPIALAANTPPAVDEAPVAAATPPSPPLPMLAMAQIAPAAPVGSKQVTPVVARPAPAIVPAATQPVAVKPPAPAPIAAPAPLAAVHAVPKPVPHVLVAGLTKSHETEPKPREAALHDPVVPEPAMHEPAMHAPAAPARRLFAPVMPAYAPAPVVVHAPTVQTASAMVSQPSPFVGSALGMGHTVLAPPVPIQSSGYASGQ